MREGGALAALLRLLHPPIRPRSIWSSPRQPGDSSLKGYYRADFEQVWRAYCDEAGTPAQASKIMVLRRP
jgi:CRISPR/Cas system CSM-associated protein Csm3 (group 7 of RAMP superfamily)